MRQRSASYQQEEDLLNHQPDPFARRSSSGRLQSQPYRVSPRLSLPQHSAIVDATSPADDAEEAPLPARKRKRSPKSATQALVVHTATTSPLASPEAASPADIQLIPRTSPAIPSVKIQQSWFHKSSPRFTFIKLSLIAFVTVSVLVATLATAGGGAVTSIFRALESVIPYSAPAQPVTATTVAQRVQPITQADVNAGYDSLQQHDTWWNSACSAAAMTEILHAWGIKDARIGQIIDVLYAHNPPYITPWGGLMSSNAWDYMMTSYHMHAAVHANYSMTYNDIVRMTENQGIPVVIDVRDSGQRYYPALSAGHFLVVVGGSAAGLRIVDSSLYRIKYLTQDVVNYLWTGLSVVITPAA